MRFLILLAVLAVAVNATSIHQQWATFKVNHSKKYGHLKEEQVRFQVFSKNLRKIEEHNARYQNGEVSFYLGVNQFADMTSEEFKAMLDSQLIHKPKRDITSRFVVDPQLTVPESIDWREKGAVNPVRDQRQCGSCWAFSAAGALEGQRFLKEGKLEVLSTQQLVDCSRDYKNEGCNGGWPHWAYDYIKDNGLCLESNYRYQGYDGYYCKECIPAIKKINGYSSINKTEEALKEAVGTAGPIAVCVNANDDWQLYSGGILESQSCPGGESINHAVLAVGYGSENGKDFWLIKNSWNTYWGEEGYLRIVRGKNQCGINEVADYPLL
uniref:Cathepsin L-like proteinase n=1 Tax=Diabrotica virgifera virgifera TaxID=50390 RepID=A0A6P7GVT5_DIAVI